ncbi:unnamed protein product [Urochloa decumbens]|uniref:Probable purine permease n=1 Tax=Urochloa decumbens TaxID=240449 RepID=A0ABC9F5T7_9POAL
MGEAGEIQLQIAGIQGQEGGDDHGQRAAGNGGACRPAATAAPLSKRLAWWATVFVNVVFVLAGQSVATLLGRIYYDQGGKSLWMQTVVQSCGTPLAIPLLIYFRTRRPSSSSSVARPPLAKLAAIYAGLGVLIAGDNLMYSYGLMYLPMSTYAIICASQLTFEEVLRSDALPTVLEMQFWSNTAAAVVSVAGLFASGEWHTIAGESAAYGKGEVAYAMTLAWTAVSWQLCTMGLMGLVAMVSSLFTNVISTVGTPLAPVIAVIFLGDRLDGVKLLAMLLAVWGLMSYVYQHYLDDRAKAKMIAEKSDEQAVQDAKISAE